MKSTNEMINPTTPPAYHLFTLTHCSETRMLLIAHSRGNTRGQRSSVLTSMQPPSFRTQSSLRAELIPWNAKRSIYFNPLPSTSLRMQADQITLCCASSFNGAATPESTGGCTYVRDFVCACAVEPVGGAQGSCRAGGTHSLVNDFSRVSRKDAADSLGET